MEKMELEQKVKRVKIHLESLGFSVNDGIKYGLDLLAYTDDPSRVHSKYGVIISNGMTFQQLVAYQRICTSNNKTLLIALVNQFDIEYFECRRFPVKFRQDAISTSSEETEVRMS
ncbi:uncharacterized protein VICG_00742 [Vittaforma corneae ATCC 50505]|uniref:tRNA-intron lyase n=1 Tax=Vittaforma corneae (strain ATCC 50505) TaxID=993615 RepID=L2GMQ5_VITCO|nr:uncharacterized protein VICG_00742 [Vittaforma corneae ATCC 50505]ELA42101.1 hypothetical protein VICG_00742 [Vittaforma corneae ATCC 50505]